MNRLEDVNFDDIVFLYVEDDDVIRRAVSIYVKRHIKNFHEACNGAEGLEKYKKYRPDIILTDIMMPEVTGLEMIEEIRKEDSNVIIIITTAYDDAEFLLKAIKAGVDSYVIKPIDRNSVTSEIAKFSKIINTKRSYDKVKNIQDNILDATNEGIFGLNLQGQHTFVNRAAAEILGYTQKEMVGKHSHSMWHNKKERGEEFAETECPIYGVLKSGKSTTIERDIFWKKDGNFIIVEYSANPIFVDEKIAGVVVTFNDITTKSKYEDELKKLSTVVKESTNTIVITDKNGEIEFANRAAQNTTGYKADELIGKKSSIFKSEKNSPEIYKKLWSEIIQGNIWNGELINKKKDGDEYWVLLSIFPIFDKDGNISNFVGIGEDITGRKKYEESLKEMNTILEKRVEEEIEKSRAKDSILYEQKKVIAMGELMRDIAHHWRQPLTAIGMLIQNIKDLYDYGELDEESLDETVNKALDQLQQLSKTIDNFRSFFKSEQSRTPFKIRKVLEDALYMLKPNLRQAKIETKILGDGLDIEIKSSINDFKQVTINILKNSIDAILERCKHEKYNPKLEIIVERDGEFCNIYFKDNGIGIDSEIANKVFDPYFTTKEQGKGSGIGLYMSKMIVEKNLEGEIFINREFKEKGVEIVVQIPIDSH